MRHMCRILFDKVHHLNFVGELKDQKIERNVIRLCEYSVTPTRSIQTGEIELLDFTDPTDWEFTATLSNKQVARTTNKFTPEFQARVYVGGQWFEFDEQITTCLSVAYMLGIMMPVNAFRDAAYDEQCIEVEIGDGLSLLFKKSFHDFINSPAKVFDEYVMDCMSAAYDGPIPTDIFMSIIHLKLDQSRNDEKLNVLDIVKAIIEETIKSVFDPYIMYKDRAKKPRRQLEI